MKSMTGYGKGEASNEHRKVTIELKAVNNRYLDCSIRIPRIYTVLEDKLKAAVQKYI